MQKNLLPFFSMSENINLLSSMRCKRFESKQQQREKKN